MAISMTEAAANHIRRSLDGRGKGEGIRLGVRTTAEGVETPEQMELLRAEGCSHFQGFLYGRPVPASERLITVSQIDGARPAATKL